MYSTWPRRGFALVVLLLLGAMLSAPVLASTADDMEYVLDVYEERSEVKLDWLEAQLGAAQSAGQRLGAYTAARNSLASYADEAIWDFFEIAGSDPELLGLAESMAIQVNEMKQEYLAEAQMMFEEYGAGPGPPTTTTTVPRTTTTSTTTTSTPTTSTSTTSTSTTTTTVKATTTTSTTSTTAPSSTTTTTPTGTTTTTAAPPAGSNPGVFFPIHSGDTSVPSTTSTTSPTAAETAPVTSATPPSSQGSGNLDPAPGESANASVPATGDFLAAFGDPLSEPGEPIEGGLARFFSAPSSERIGDIGSVEALPLTGVLVGYVPAGLPEGFSVPVVGLMAIFEMMLGAFGASFRQLGGPLSAAGSYLGYSVWRHLVAKV